jgi:hypothetical protein
MSQTNLYILDSNDNYGIYTGLRNSKQLLLGPLDRSSSVVLEFSSNGCFEGYAELSGLSAESPTERARISATELLASGTYIQANIRFAPFVLSLDNLGIAAYDIPFHLSEALKDPVQFCRSEGVDEFLRYCQIVADWCSSGQYVLDWGDELYVNTSGIICCG